jgi:uncharacterized protein (TIGR02001 family)
MGGKCRLCTICALYLGAFCVHAQGQFGGSLAGTTDYAYRGVSQTRGKPAVQGDLHYETATQFNNDANSRWSVGVWASTMDLNPGPGPTLEVDAWLGRNWTIAEDWDVSLRYTHYFYPNDPRPLSYDYDEFVASVGFRSRLYATVAWSPDASRYSNAFAAKDRNATSYELTAVQPLTRHLSLTGGLGYYDLTALFNHGYWYYNASLTYSMDPVALSVAYIGTDYEARELFGYRSTSNRWAVTALWRF